MAMRNIHNLITDAFKEIRKPEENYEIHVGSSNRFTSVYIAGRDNSNGVMNLYLAHDSAGRLTNLDGNNSLFSNDEWWRIFSIFEDQIYDEDEDE